MGFTAFYPSYKTNTIVGWVEQRETHQPEQTKYTFSRIGYKIRHNPTNVGCEMIKKQFKRSVNRLRQCLLQIPELELAILIGSQASGKAQINSDWDIAIRWHRQPDISIITVLAQTETVRRTLAQRLEVTEDKIDLIDLTHARLTMRAVVAEEGLILKGENTLAWHYFLQRTWRELEEFYWNQCYAA